MAKDVVFVDVETTGLDPEKDSVVQIGVLRTDSTGATVKSRLDIKVKPTTVMSPEAAAVNGYTEEGWVDAVDAETAANMLASIAQGAEFAAHCVWFDHAFCTKLLERNRVRVPWGRRLIDTQTLAHLLRETQPAMQGTNLSSAIYALGGSRSAAHDAMEDASWAREIYAWAMRTVLRSSEKAA